jgi:hypothetical protein
MIVENIATTVDAQERVNCAPMGVELGDEVIGLKPSLERAPIFNVVATETHRDGCPTSATTGRVFARAPIVSRIWDVSTLRSHGTVNGVSAAGGSLDGPGPVIVGGMSFVNLGLWNVCQSARQRPTCVFRRRPLTASARAVRPRSVRSPN